jgi:hypothetical protein
MGSFHDGFLVGQSKLFYSFKKHAIFLDNLSDSLQNLTATLGVIDGILGLHCQLTILSCFDGQNNAFRSFIQILSL